MSRLTRLGLLAAALATLAGCGTKPTKKPRLQEIERIPRLETIAPEKRPTLTLQRQYTATIEPMEKADLHAQIRGVVQTMSLNADIGRYVHGESVSPLAIGSSLPLLNGSPAASPLLAAAILVAGRTESEVLITLAIPDVIAERDNKRAQLALAIELKQQAIKARDVAAEEIKEATAARQRWAADVEFRESQYQRMVRLVSTDTVQKQIAEESRLQYKSSQAALDAADAQILTKRARLRSAEGEIAVAEAKIKVAAAELERLEATVGFATIRAPFDGTVTKRWIDRGAPIKDFSMPLLTVMRTDVLRVIIDVPERDMPYIHAASDPGVEGNRVLLRVPALKDLVLNGEFTGEVTLTAASLDPVTRTMRTEVHIPNRAGLLKPQMSGTATVVLAERKDVFTIPSSALVRQGDKVYVFCVAEIKGVTDRGAVRRVEVEVGVDDGHVAEIRRGLTGREQIITKGNGMVREGDFAIAVPVR